MDFFLQQRTVSFLVTLFFAGAVFFYFQNGADAQRGCASSVVEGTKVNVRTGSANVETLQRYTSVLAYDFNKNTGGFYDVTQIYSGNVQDIVEVMTLKGDVVKSTPENLFWVHNKRKWIPARNLTPDDFLVDSGQEKVGISRVTPVHLEKPVKVYNFTLQRAGAFYISEGQVLVKDCS